MSAMSPLEILRSRGMIENVSHEQSIDAVFLRSGITIYVGFDPTAPSLHVGHLLPIMALAHLQRAGCRPIILVGGATGMIGDPSGRSTERQLLTPEATAENARGIRRQLECFVSFEGTHGAIMVDNSDWIHPFSYVDWLRDVGKHFTVNYMLAKESVRRRLEDREHGISYTEFSYMLLQAYDFLHLYDTYGCLVQGGGADQWGNIMAGIDLVRKVRGAEVFGITFPLVSTAGGEKFGKSAGNAIWLDLGRTSAYQFYQFWIRTDDRDVERYLRFFTFLDLPDIARVMEGHERSPERREAQRVLAAEVTRLTHGEEAMHRVCRAAEVLFGREISGLSDAELLDVFADVPSTQLSKNLLSEGVKLIELLKETGVCGSRNEARRMVQNGGIYVNNQAVSNPDVIITYEQLASDSILVLRSGKKNYHLVRFTAEC